MPATVEALDSKGRHVPTASLPVEFSISGSGHIIGLGNGNPNSHKPEKGNNRSLYNGLAQVIIQTLAGGTEPILLKAFSPGLNLAVASIAIVPHAAFPYVASATHALILDKWMLSPVSLALRTPILN